jgi:hypothetical protein
VRCTPPSGGALGGAAAVVLALLAGSGCAATTAATARPGAALPAARLDVTSPDPVAAARALAAAITAHPEHGLHVIYVQGDQVAVRWRIFKYLLEPRLAGPGGVNYLRVSQHYALRDSAVDQEEAVARACRAINHRYDFLSTRIERSRGRRLFVARSHLAFADSLSLTRLTEYLKALKRVTLVIAANRLRPFLD